MDDLKKLRKQIDQLDEQIMHILKKRMEIVKEIGKIKTIENMPILDEKRKQKLLIIKKNIARKLGLSEELAHDLFTLIHDYAINIQIKVN